MLTKPRARDIGIPLGGKEPAEIAVSILAELIKVKNEREA